VTGLGTAVGEGGPESREDREDREEPHLDSAALNHPCTSSLSLSLSLYLASVGEGTGRTLRRRERLWRPVIGYRRLHREERDISTSPADKRDGARDAFFPLSLSLSPPSPARHAAVVNTATPTPLTTLLSDFNIVASLY
jgi:hypothetical protein